MTKEAWPQLYVVSATVLAPIGSEVKELFGKKYHKWPLTDLWFSNQKTQKSEVRQVTKDIVKSEVYP